MKKHFEILFRLMVISALLLTAYSCSDDDPVNPTPVGPENNSINGFVTFVDTNFITSGGVYLISAYPSVSWPPMGGPSAYDTIDVSTSRLTYEYKLVGLSTGTYVVSVGFRKTTGGQSPIMSVYGCDTARFLNGAGSSCFLNPPLNAIIGTNNEGVEGIDMLSWADTTNKIF